MKKLSKLQIKTLGRFEIYYGDDLIMPNISSKAAGLFCFLSMCPEMSSSREQLSSLFWDDEGGDTAKHNLRFTTWQIKRLFSENFGVENIVYNDKNIIHLTSEIAIESDAEQLKAQYKDAVQSNHPIPIYQKIRELYAGDFLENYEFKNCFKFNDWIFYEKENLQRIYFDVLNRLADHYKFTEQDQEAIDTYREMLRVNPFVEESHVMLIRAYLKIGDRSSAISQYERCCSLLRDELNVAPMESTRMVYREIITGKSEKEGSDVNRVNDDCVSYGSHSEFTVSQQKHRNSVMTGCNENSIPYYWIWSLVEGLLDSFPAERLKQVSKKYWADVSQYNSRVDDEIDICETDVRQVHMIRYFSSLYSILRILSESEPIHIFIENEEYMDEKSGKFYSMLKSRLSSINVVIHTMNN